MIKTPHNFKSRKEWENFLWNYLVERLSKSKSGQELSDDLNALISDYERSLLLKRITTALLLTEGKSYTEIGELLWISPSTISAIKKNFSGITGGYIGRKKLFRKPYSALSKEVLSQYAVTKKKSKMKAFLDIINDIHFQEAYSNAAKRWDFLNH